MSILLTGAGGGYDPHAMLYFNQVVANGGQSLPVDWKIKINLWFLTQKANGNFYKMVRFHLLYNANEIAARTSLINPTQAMWEYPADHGVFRCFNGVAIGRDGNGAVNFSYVKTKFIPSTDGGAIYTSSSGAFGYGVTSNVDGAFVDMGVQDGTRSDYCFSAFSGDSYSKLNTTNTGNGLVVANAANLDANYTVTRNSTTLTFYKNNTGTPGTDAIVGLCTKEHYLGAFNNNGPASLFKIANYTWFGFMGGDIDVAANNAAVNALFVYKNAYFYGDSITAGHIGVSAHSPYCWSSLLCQNKLWSEKNYAVGGTSLENAIPVDPEGTSPNMYDQRNNIPVYNASTDAKLFICYGVNDCGFNFAATYTPANFSSQLGTIIDVAISKGWPLADIIINTATYINDPVGWNTYTILGCPAADDTRFLTFISGAQTVAGTKGVTFVSPRAYMAANGGNSLLYDGVHPTVPGYAVIYAYMLTQNL